MTILHALKLLALAVLHNNCFEYWYGFLKKQDIPEEAGKNKIYFLMTPDYGNIGDQAIAFAGRCFLEENYPDHQIVEVPLHLTCRYLHTIRSKITENDMVFLQGGGNMGNLYRDIDNIRLWVFKVLRKSKMVLLPVTACFTDTFRGKLQLRKNQRGMSRCEDLTLIAREEDTFDLMRKNFRCKILLSPDMAFYLSDKLGRDREKNTDKKYILTALRQDREGKIDRESIQNLIIKTYQQVHAFDTTVDRKIGPSERVLEINTLLDEIEAARILVTDRMHGMIFAAILGTQCIALEEKGHKIQGSYKWINDVSHVCVLSGEAGPQSLLEEIDKREGHAGEAVYIPDFSGEFAELKKKLL